MAVHRNGAGPTTAYSVDAETMTRRLKIMYSHWRKHNDDLWGSCTVFSVSTPPPSEDIRYLKSSALNIWLFGYEFPETIMVFTRNRSTYVPKRKPIFFNAVKKSAKQAVGVDVVMHIKASKNSSKNYDYDDMAAAQMDDIINAVNDGDHRVFGYIAKEAPEGKLIGKWSEKIKSSSIQLSDITNGLADLFAVKEPIELTYVKKAAYLTASAMKQFVVPKLERVIDEEKKVTHSSLSYDTEKAIKEPSRIKVKLKAEKVDICYCSIFQSGGKFDLKPSASINDDNLYYESGSVIICALGVPLQQLLCKCCKKFSD